MTEPAASAPGPPATAPVPPNSRYSGVPLLSARQADGTDTRYFARRFLPDPERMQVIAQYRVRDGDRLDTIAANAFGDSELWWRVADANRAGHPRDLVSAADRVLRLTQVAGFEGFGRA